MALLTNINGKFSVSDAGAVTFNNAFTFPTADGTANYILKTNGSGQLAWAADNYENYDYWILQGDSAANTNINSTNTLKFVGGTYIDTSATWAGGSNPRKLTINHETTSRTDTTSTDEPAFGGTFEAVTSITTNTTGHVTAIDVSTVTIPSDSGFVTGSGTLNKVARWTATGSDIGDGPITFSAATATANSTFGGDVYATGTSNSFVVISRDNMFVDAGQFYLGADDGITDDSYRMYATSGQFVLASRKSGTWTTYFDINSSGNSTFAGNIYLADGTQRNIIGPTNQTLGIFARPNNSTEGIKFSTDGGTTTEMFIQDGGNVGIGTISPNQLLELSKNGSPVMRLNSSKTTNGAIGDSIGRIEWRGSNNAGNGAGIKAAIDTSATSTTQRDFDILFKTGNNVGSGEPDTRMVIEAAGNVGIGTVSPITKLTINNGVARTSTAKTYSTFVHTNDSDDFRVGFATAIKGGTTSADRYVSLEATSYQVSTGVYSGGIDLVLNPLGGNVGIGTASPSQKLHLYNGTLLIDSDAGISTGIWMPDVNGNPSLRVVTDQSTASNSSIVNAWGNSSNAGVMLGTTRNDGTAFQIRSGVTLTSGFANDTGSTRMIVLGNGNVGIGTTSPQMGLHVADTKGALFGPSGSGTASAYFSPSDENTLNGSYGKDDDNGDIWLNYRGYQDGFTRFRDTRIGNGKGGLVAIFDGSTGNVGIGTVSPQTKLHVEGRVRMTYDGNTAFYSGNYVRLFNSQAYQFRNSGGSVIANINLSGDSYFNGGNVGIGVTGPQHKLDVRGSGTILQIKNTDATTVDAVAQILTQSGSAQGLAFVTNQASTSWGGASSYNFYTNVGPIAFFTAGNSTSSRLFIEAGGEVGVNNSIPSATLHLTALSSNGVPFKLQGHASTTTNQMLIYTTKIPSTSWYYLVGQSVSAAGNQIIIYGNGNIQNANNSYGQISDIRLKENIVNATPKLEDIKKLKVKNFNFIGDDLKQIGLIAQEVEEVFPGLIDEDKQPDIEDGPEGEVYKSVKYSVLVPMLVKAMQEQQEIIENLKTRIEQLEN